jgi:hypothetical protein
MFKMAERRTCRAPICSGSTRAGSYEHEGLALAIAGDRSWRIDPALGPHVWKFYVSPKDALEETVATCRNEADRLFGVEVAREEAAQPIPRSILGQTPAGLHRDSFVEDCITKQGWCIIFSKPAPATFAASFLPRDRFAASLYVYRYLGYPASCEPPASRGK